MASTGSEATGRDLGPLLRGDAIAWDRDGVPLEFVRELRPGHPFHEGGWRGFRTDRYKATWRLTADGPVAWHLYDLEADPHELDNLVDDPSARDLHHELHARLRRELRRTADDFELGDPP